MRSPSPIRTALLLAAPLLPPILAPASEPLHAQEVEEIELGGAISRALEMAPAAVAARSQLSSAEADLLQSRGALLPTLSVNGIYGNSSNQRFDQTSGRLVSQNYTAQLQGTYEIFAGGRRFAQLRAAGADVDAAEASYTAQRFQTVLTTTETFYSAAAASELVAAAEQRLGRARQQLEFAETRLELGTVTRSDVLRAEMEVGDAELGVLEAQAGLQDATLRLGRQIGEDHEVRPAAQALPESAPDLPPVEELVGEALDHAPSVVAAVATERSREADRLAAYTPYIPSLRLSGGYDWFAFSFPPEQRSWSLRLIASLPIFNGFQREAALSRARAAERTAEARARDARLAVRVDIETAVQQIGLAERRVEISDRGLELAREDLRVQEERYQIGSATIIDLQTSQVALGQAEVDAITARQALGSSVARLEAILGRELDRSTANE